MLSGKITNKININIFPISTNKDIKINDNKYHTTM